ncbi:hypothetical protein [Aureimonas frigidaquae]|uniref:Uncharacterized protein n=1 Tax=Aureimonas frigidaquae TaxID=424757 RepID=A0A0P0Z456_9HYPH|nr:hypothetical protein [Aureimonas frigidaquae]BAT28736.1 hypothetical protein [Aureimonas frigidaquae]
MLQLTPETMRYLRNFQIKLEEKEQAKAIRRAAEQKRALGERKTAAMVETIIPILRIGQPTMFQFEGTCRYAVRVLLISRGFTWADADANALEVVRIALGKIGAKRPSWLQGQPEYREPDPTSWRHRHCAGCGGILEEFHRGTHCCEECASITRKREWQRDNRDKMNALVKAWSRANPEKIRAQAARYKARMEVRPCKHCQTPFQGLPRVEFCTPRCGYDWRRAEHARKNEQACGYCGGLFVPRPRKDRKSKSAFCSKSCFFSAIRSGGKSIFQCEAAE